MPLIRRPSGPVPRSEDQVAPDLNSASADARWAAVRRMDAPRDLPALQFALEKEADPRVREAIFTSLARIGGAEAVQGLARQIRADDAGLRTGALDALRTMGPEVAVVLPELLSDPDADVRLLACELARAAPGDQATALLCHLLGSEAEPNVAAAAVEVLAEVGDAQALSTLDGAAARFSGEPFLVFAIRVARDRIGAR